MRIIIEIDDDLSDATVIRQLQDMQKRSDGPGMGFVSLETDLAQFYVRIEGVVPAEVKSGETYRMAAWIPLEEA